MSYYLHNLFSDITYIETKNYDTLVLSAGSVKGFVLLGSIQYLYDTNRLGCIKNYVATSVGSVIAYLLCIGYTPIEIMSSLHVNDWLENLKNFNVTNILSDKGVASFIYIQEALEKLTLNKVGKFLTLKNLYDEYNKNLTVCTYNMTKCKPEYLNYLTFPDLPCITALRMSSNIPIFFDRFRYMNSYYIDGALTDGFPILKGLEIGKEILGINLTTSNEIIKDAPEKGFMDYFFKLIHIPMKQSIDHKNELALVNENCKIVNLGCDSIASFMNFNISKIERLNMFSSGYNQTKINFEV